MRVDALVPPEPMDLDGDIGQRVVERLAQLRAAVDDLQTLVDDSSARADGLRASAALLDALRRAGDATREAQKLAAHYVLDRGYLTWRDAARALGTTTPTIMRWRAEVTEGIYRETYPEGPPVNPLNGSA